MTGFDNCLYIFKGSATSVLDCIAQCLWKHRSNQKIILYSFILFRTCVDIILNMFCPFGLLEAFPWNVFVSFFHRNSCVLYKFFPLPGTIIYRYIYILIWCQFFSAVFLFRNSHLLWFLFGHFPFQELSHLIWFLFGSFPFPELSHLMWNLFRIFLFRERSHLKWFLFRNVPFQKRSHMMWILLWFSRLRNVIRDRIRYIHGLNYS